ncbi:hypothetical protein EV646_108258 [Kribbella antiqua]|uniref:Uncharacterized protein n=1 Tax=Kribbella antiqua TaxID=2512217 RepID=A0A4R2IS62_9ACTN|nr:hypothetical protein [Kribbella antiqua]TCO45635.1 hypothetical protein EV646_108258 [Kribbella antiqua]
MSSIVPGPRKKLEEEISAARAGGKPLSVGDLNPSAPRQVQLTGLDDWPQPLRAVIEADHQRVTALSANRRKTADLVLPDLVHGLGELLDLVADQLQAGKPRLLRRSSAAPADASFGDVAELLGIPSDNPPSGRGERRTALRTIKELHGQLKELETSHDHSRLTRLVTFVVRLAVVVDSVPEATAALAPIALDRFARAEPDFQWDWTFDRKLEFWQESRRTLSALDRAAEGEGTA